MPLLVSSLVPLVPLTNILMVASSDLVVFVTRCIPVECHMHQCRWLDDNPLVGEQALAGFQSGTLVVLLQSSWVPTAFGTILAHLFVVSF